MKQNHSRKFMKKIAPSGGNATLKKYGSEHFAKIANKRWNKCQVPQCPYPHVTSAQKPER
jgi:hypothetical protein